MGATDLQQMEGGYAVVDGRVAGKFLGRQLASFDQQPESVGGADPATRHSERSQLLLSD